MISELDLATLAAAIDIVIPPDEWPGGWDGGTADLIAHEPGIGDPMLEAARPALAFEPLPPSATWSRFGVDNTFGYDA